MKQKLIGMLRWSERYTKTDMVYLARGSFWMYLSYFAINILGFVLSIAFAKLLPKEVYGTYQFILSVGAILSALTLTGMNNAVIQAVVRGFEGSVRSSIPVQLKYNLLSLVAGLGVAAYYFIQGNLEIALGVALLSFLIPIFSAFNTYTALISGKKDFKAGFVYSLYLILPYNAVMLAAIWLFKDPIILVAASFGANCVIAIILYYAALRKYRPNDSHDPATISYGKHLSAAAVIGAIAGQIDNILVFHFLGTAQLAIYAFASTIPERLNGALKSITIMAFPKLSQKTTDELKKGVVAKSLRLAALTFAISLIYVLCAPFLFKAFFPQYLDSILYSQAYSLMLVLATLSSFPVTTLTAAQAKKEIYIYSVASPVINVALMCVLTATHGIWGLILAKGLSGLSSYILSLVLVKKVRGPVVS